MRTAHCGIQCYLYAFGGIKKVSTDLVCCFFQLVKKGIISCHMIIHHYIHHSIITIKSLWIVMRFNLEGNISNQDYLYLNRAIGLMSRVFANGLGDRGSIPGWVIPKTQNMVFDASLLSIIRYGSRVKWINPGKGAVPFLHLGVVAIEKGTFWSPSTKGDNLLYWFLEIPLLISSLYLIFIYKFTNISSQLGFLQKTKKKGRLFLCCT